MVQPENKPRVAQPAEEEIKKHGDQLAKQVQDAAGHTDETKQETPAQSSSKQ